jgi:hypothetical protein
MASAVWSATGFVVARRITHEFISATLALRIHLDLSLRRPSNIDYRLALKQQRGQTIPAKASQYWTSIVTRRFIARAAASLPITSG